MDKRVNNINVQLKQTLAKYLYIIAALLLFVSQYHVAHAEGTKDLNINGGNRISTLLEGNAYPGNDSTEGMTTDVYVYAEEGEYINMASTKNVDSWGYIEYFSPNGNAFRCFIPAQTDDNYIRLQLGSSTRFLGILPVSQLSCCSLSRS